MIFKSEKISPVHCDIYVFWHPKKSITYPVWVKKHHVSYDDKNIATYSDEGCGRVVGTKGVHQKWLGEPVETVIKYFEAKGYHYEKI